MRFKFICETLNRNIFHAQLLFVVHYPLKRIISYMNDDNLMRYVKHIVGELKQKHIRLTF